MNILFVVNNKNDRLAKVLPSLRQCCEQTHWAKARLVFTLGKAHAMALARQAAENRCDFVIAVGGDGTLNEVVNGVLQSDVPAHELPTIGLLPYGSANDFARTAQISQSLEALMALIRTHTAQRIDLGKILLRPSRETRFFINMAGVGLGAEVAKNIERSSSVLGPGFHYFKHIIKGFLGYSKKEVSCTGGSWQWKGRLLQMAVANGRYFGNGLCIAPEARVADGQFQVAIFGNLSIWDYLKNLGKLKKGVKISHPQVAYHDAQEVLLESDGACGIEADGEYVGLAPATLSVLPKAINFLMSPGVR